MENVLAVKRELIKEFLPQKDVSFEIPETLVDIIINNYEFLPRSKAELDPSYKQIIPYVVLCNGENVYVTRRLKKGAESRLHGLLSLGIGGHINPESDGNGSDVLYRGMIREINEEVNTIALSQLSPRGVINDDTNEVGSVHLGLFYTLEVSEETGIRETEKLEGFWLKRSELPGFTEQMETWSQLIISELSKESE